MSFASPIALVLALLAAPIIGLYILKVRLRRVPISTNIFWKQIFDERPPRSIWQHLRHLLSLLIQLALLAFLTLAAADPILTGQTRQTRRLVAVIDNSASMRAEDVKPSRFEAARDSAIALAEGLRLGDEMAIVLAGPRPEVLLGMSDHIPTLKRTLRAIKVSDNPTALAGATELGKQLIGDHPHGSVIVFSDFCTEPADGDGPATYAEAAAAPASPADKPRRADGVDGASSHTVDAVAAAISPIHVEHRVFATPADNVGITQFQVRRSLTDPLGYEVLVAVRNASQRAVRCRVELELDGLPVDILPVELTADGRWTRSLEKTSLDGGRLRARLTQIAPLAAATDANRTMTEGGEALDEPLLNSLATDDIAWAVLPARRIERVLIVTPGNLFLQKVFEANPLVEVEVVRDLPATWPADAIVVLHRHVPAQLPPGRLFIVDPFGDSDAWRVEGVVENPLVTELDASSLLLTHIRLDNVIMPEARKLVFKSPVRVLAGAVTGDAIYAEVSRPGGRCFVLTVNLDEGDLAFRTAFPILVANALSAFAGRSGELRESLATGQTLEQSLSDEVALDTPLVLRSPSGQQFEVVRRASVDAGVGENSAAQPHQKPTQADAVGSSAADVTLGPFDENGVWTVGIDQANRQTKSIVELAVNLANERESDLRPPEGEAQYSSEPFSTGWRGRPPWFWLVTAASVLFVAEWLMYQRRVIV